VRTFIRLFFAAGFAYSFAALAIYLSGNASIIVGTSLIILLAAFYGTGKLRQGNGIAILLGVSAVILLIFGFVASGYAIKDAEAKRASEAVSK
jgi:hypothetical protein